MKNNTKDKQPMSATEKTFNGKSFEELDKNDFLDLLAGYTWMVYDILEKFRKKWSAMR